MGGFFKWMAKCSLYGIAFFWPYILVGLFSGYLLEFIPQSLSGFVAITWPVLPLGLAIAALKGNPANKYLSWVSIAICLWYGIPPIGQVISFIGSPANDAFIDAQLISPIGWVKLLFQPGVPSVFFGGLFDIAASIAAGLMLAPFIGKMATGSLNRLPFRRSTSGLHGNAQWLSRKQIDLLSREGGLIIGQTERKPNSKLIKYKLEAHGITVAPTRSGKGVSFIIMNILAPGPDSWPGPIVAMDPKLETLFVAGRRRASLGRDVINIDPFEVAPKKIAERPDLQLYKPRQDRYNFLDLIPRDRNMVSQINVLLDALLVPPKQGEKHFYDCSRILIGGAIADVLLDDKYDGRRNLGTVYDLLRTNAEAFNEWLNDKSVDLDYAGGLPANAANLLLGVGDRERGSIMSSTRTALKWLDIDYLRDNVSESTFDLNDLLSNKLDIFIGVPPAMLDQARVFLRVWATLPLNMAMNGNAEERILQIVDEAPLLKRLDPVLDAFRVAAGMNFSVWLITQTIADLEIEYGKEEVKALFANAEVVSFFEVSPTDKSLANDLSELLGSFTVIEESTSSNSGTSGKPIDALLSTSTSSGTSTKEARRALMLPDEIRALASDEVIVITRSKDVDGVRTKGPIKAFQAKYFERPECATWFDPNPYRKADKPAANSNLPQAA